MAELNPSQRAAVRHIDGPLLVLAGAGSGKTSVITRKIAYLVQQCGIRPERIAAVTFTNKAAREMRARVGRLVDGHAADALTVSTFHQLGLGIIRRHLRALGLRPGFSIFDNEDSLNLLKELLRQHHPAAVEQAPAIAQQISAWKGAALDPVQAARQPPDAGAQLAAQAYRVYDESLRAFNAVDFDDLILLPLVLLRDDPQIRQQWQEQIHYLLVDEYQDTNVAQYQLVQQLVGVRAAFTVVGDDDQSIYAWRGAHPENLAQLGRDYPALRVIKLEQNYRSTARILQAANTLISHNPHLFEKTLWSELGHGARLRVLQCADEEAEVEQVVAEILDHRLRQRTQFGDYAVLYRSNHQARPLELALQRQQVPYQMSGGTSFFARNEIKDVMAYLRLLLNRDDDNAFLRVLNVPRRGLGAAALATIGQEASRRQCSLARAAGALPADALSAQASRSLAQFMQLIEQTRQQLASSGGISPIRELLRSLRYEAWLHDNASSEEVARRRMGNVQFLLDSLDRSMQQGGNGIEDGVAQLVLRDLLEQQEEQKASADSVQLLTLHAAKGLEFPHVYLIGMEENLLPHRNSIDSGDISEERRLAYVGITRAQQTLSLSWARTRRQYGQRVDCEPSRFLAELPQEDIEWSGGEAQDRAANTERGQATLSSLQSLFDD